LFSVCGGVQERGGDETTGVSFVGGTPDEEDVCSEGVPPPPPAPGEPTREKVGLGVSETPPNEAEVVGAEVMEVDVVMV
jgi:hypothetical protein